LLAPLNWIKEYVDVELSPDELAEALTMAGLETVNLGSRVPDVDGVVTARIEKIEKHPDADKLTVCQVAAAEGEAPRTVVCGAPNIREGDVVPLAGVGVVFPDGNKLKRAKIRGVESNGMMCSQKELGVGDDHSGIWILPAETPIGKTLPQALGDDDVILETEPTPNRGDLLSIVGLAREIAAITGKKSRLPEVKLEESGPAIADLARVDVEDFDGCPRYAARLIRGVKVGPSPGWVAERLEAAGVRAINNVVDATNYVMLEMGQPLHAFDFNRLRENRIVVKRATAGDKFITLDQHERALRDDTLMICDGAGPVAIAGVMGGIDSEVGQDTVDVLLESACFNPTVIRRTARILGIPSEASRRFDKGVDPLGTVIAADRSAALIREFAGGEIANGAIDVIKAPIERKRITLRPERCNKVLGLALSCAEQAAALSRLAGMEVEEKDGVIEVVAPSYRPDLCEEHDLIEEVARLVGYDKAPATMPSMRMSPAPRRSHLAFNRVARERLAALGFFEVALTNFEDPARLGMMRLSEDDPRLRAVKLKNPLSQNESALRSTLLPKLLDCLARNRRQGATQEVRLHEISAVFEDAGDELPLQRSRIAGVISGAVEKTLWDGGAEVDGYYLVKGVVEQLLNAVGFPGARIEVDPQPEPFLHPGKSARVMVGRSRAGTFGEIHPLVAESMEIHPGAFLFDLDFDMLYEHVDYTSKAVAVSKFPPVLRDIAVVVDEKVAMADVVKVANKLKSPILSELMVFDVFRGGTVPEGGKSMAFHARYQSLERTLTDDEVGKEHNRLAKELESKLKAALR